MVAPKDPPETRDREAWIDCYLSWFLHYYGMQPIQKPRDREIAEKWAHDMAYASLWYPWSVCYGDKGAKSFFKLRQDAQARLPKAILEFLLERDRARLAADTGFSSCAAPVVSSAQQIHSEPVGQLSMF